MSNMEIWSKVNKTDPNHTKPVSLGRKFTAIDAHYQIMRATETFGPIGIGWGYEVEHSTIEAGATVLAVADVTLWHGKREQRFGPWRGLSELINSKGKLDDDAAKKATTDALTKALSHLGFNADVFLGLFDDNKYVAKLRKEFSDKDEPANGMMTDDELNMAIGALSGCADLEQLKGIFAGAWKRCPADHRNILKSAYDEAKANLEQTEERKAA